jgi:WXG100 family type VII secretion target
MSNGTGAGLSQADGALSTAAGHVATARGDVTRSCQQLGDQMAGLSGRWVGQSGAAFTRLMVAWQERQHTILDALGQLSEALEQTDRVTTATDTTQAEAVLRLQGRLG